MPLRGCPETIFRQNCSRSWLRERLVLGPTATPRGFLSGQKSSDPATLPHAARCPWSNAHLLSVDRKQRPTRAGQRQMPIATKKVSCERECLDVRVAAIGSDHAGEKHNPKA